MTYVFDTSAYSELNRGQVDMAKLVIEADEILLPQVCVAELRYGFAIGSRQLENEKLLVRFLSSAKVRQVFPNDLTTDHYIEQAVHMRKNGKQLSHHDLWIAALAEQHEATLVTFDEDFNYVPKRAPNVLLLKVK